MTFDIPGSTRVVSFEDTLPYYAEIFEANGEKFVRIPLTGNPNKDVNRYYVDEAVNAVVKSIMTGNANIDPNLSVKGFYEYAYDSGNTSIAATIQEVKKTMRQ